MPVKKQAVYLYSTIKEIEKMKKKTLKPIVRVYNITLTNRFFSEEGENVDVEDEIFYDFNSLESKEYRNLLKWSYYDYITQTLEKEYFADADSFEYEVLPPNHYLYDLFLKSTELVEKEKKFNRLKNKQYICIQQLKK